MDGYLMAYFKDQTQSAYMAISRDGYTFVDVNQGQPVFEGKLHGAVAHLALDKLKAVAKHWHVSIKLD